VPADSAFGADSTQTGPDEALVTTTTLSKTADGAFRIPAARTARSAEPSIPQNYAAWTTTEPPRTIPRDLAPDPSLIERRGDYRPAANLTHRVSFGLPFYDSETGDFGISGITSWTEPLGKHTVNAAGSLSFTEPGTESEIVATYLNRQLYPTIGLGVFSASSSARIYGDDFTREVHPYTLCGPSDAETLTITVKALGDYTRRLYERLEAGVEVSLEGPYGRFDYRDGGDRQIWIAGGVGVAPFLSWARNLAHEGAAAPDVDFYYCVHDRTDAVYRDEFEALSQEFPTVNVALVCSVEEGHLHARDLGDVTDTDVFLCGPKRLTQDLRRQLRRRDVPDARIHFEDFEFR
jgi:NAD(P)H-flavin reductase